VDNVGWGGTGTITGLGGCRAEHATAAGRSSAAEAKTVCHPGKRARGDARAPERKQTKQEPPGPDRHGATAPVFTPVGGAPGTADAKLSRGGCGTAARERVLIHSGAGSRSGAGDHLATVDPRRPGQALLYPPLLPAPPTSPPARPSPATTIIIAHHLPASSSLLFPLSFPHSAADSLFSPASIRFEFPIGRRALARRGKVNRDRARSGPAPRW
jgi:hypothetical protein